MPLTDELVAHDHGRGHRQQLKILEKLFSAQEPSPATYVLVGGPEPSRTLYPLVEMCAEPAWFLVSCRLTRYAIKTKSDFYATAPSDALLELIKDLKLQHLDIVDPWKGPLRRHLVDKHEGQYGSARLERILDVMFDGLDSPFAYLCLLSACADPLRFQVQAALAESAALNSGDSYCFMGIRDDVVLII